MAKTRRVPGASAPGELSAEQLRRVWALLDRAFRTRSSERRVRLLSEAVEIYEDAMVAWLLERLHRANRT